MLVAYSKEKREIIYVDGLFENVLQEKVVKNLEDKFLKLPIKVVMFSESDIKKLIENFECLSFNAFFGNIRKINFDIGELGVW
jgi:hypothetical protein